MLKEVGREASVNADLREEAPPIGKDFDVFRFARRYIWLFVLVPIISVAISLVVALNTTKLYTAQASVAMEQNRSAIALVGATSGVFDPSQVATEVALVESAVMARSVLQNLGITEEEQLAALGLIDTGPGFDPVTYLKDWVKEFIGNSTPALELLIDPTDPEELKMLKLAEKVRQNVDIYRDGQSYVLVINSTSRNPIGATQLANAYAEAYVGDKLQRRVQQARNGAKWLQKKLDEIRIQMNSAALAVQHFMARGDYRLNGNANSKNEVAENSDTQSHMPDVTLEELESRALTYRKIFESYLQTYADTIQKQSYPVTNARVISRASGLATKTWPKTTMMLLFGFIAGCIVALAIALIIEGASGVLATDRLKNAS